MSSGATGEKRQPLSPIAKTSVVEMSGQGRAWPLNRRGAWKSNPLALATKTWMEQTSRLETDRQPAAQKRVVFSCWK
jgi:hypothetical protein